MVGNIGIVEGSLLKLCFGVQWNYWGASGCWIAATGQHNGDDHDFGDDDVESDGVGDEMGASIPADAETQDTYDGALAPDPNVTWSGAYETIADRTVRRYPTTNRVAGHLA